MFTFCLLNYENEMQTKQKVVKIFLKYLNKKKINKFKIIKFLFLYLIFKHEKIAK